MQSLKTQSEVIMKKIKLILSAILIVGWKYLSAFLAATGTVNAGSVAALQFENSDAAFTKSMVGMEFFKSMSSGASFGVLLAILVVIWWKELTGAFKQSSNDVLKLIIAAVIAVPLSMAYSPDANAYYSKQDWAEWYNVLPNHSAFLIPSTGDTKDAQKQFESESFLNEKKVGSKRIQIPHVILKNSGVVDAYVPGAILILLDRTPYVVHWEKEVTKESPTNQEMCVESQDSIQICFDVSIGANVLEEDAAKYLYWFGVEPATGSDDERNFPSMLQGKSLQNVMNTRVFARIHAAYFVEFSKFTFLDALAHKGEILKDVETQMIAEYKKMGISIEYVGIASEFRFDTKLQDSITNLQISKYDQQAAEAKLAAAKVERYKAETEVMLAQTEPYKKWNGQLPNLPSVMVSSDAILGWFKSAFSKSETPVK